MLNYVRHGAKWLILVCVIPPPPPTPQDESNFRRALADALSDANGMVPDSGRPPRTAWAENKSRATARGVSGQTAHDLALGVRSDGNLLIKLFNLFRCAAVESRNETKQKQ